MISSARRPSTTNFSPSCGAGRFMEEETFIAWAVSPEAPAISVTKPYDGNAATVGNGMMVALAAPRTLIRSMPSTPRRSSSAAPTRERPGPRGDSGFYAGYFRDLDGNKLSAFCMTKPA